MVVLYHQNKSTVVITNDDKMQMSYVESTNTIFWTCPNTDGGFDGGICKYTVGGTTFQCFKPTFYNSTYAVAGITDNIVYYAAKHSGADTMAFMKADFTDGSINLWTKTLDCPNPTTSS